MNDLSLAEENYLKAIYAEGDNEYASTSNLSDRLETKASSVTDMLKKLSAKKLVDYKKYQGARLTKEGRLIAIRIVRKHRLWEVFLVDKLDFGWDEVHDIAEQLEHIKSPELIRRLDEFLGHPTADPHGDPIPDTDGNLPKNKAFPLSEGTIGKKYIICGVADTSSLFLQYLDKQGLILGTEIIITDKIDFDKSIQIKFAKKEINLSSKAVNNIMVE